MKNFENYNPSIVFENGITLSDPKVQESENDIVFEFTSDKELTDDILGDVHKELLDQASSNGIIGKKLAERKWVLESDRSIKKDGQIYPLKFFASHREISSDKKHIKFYFFNNDSRYHKEF